MLLRLVNIRSNETLRELNIEFNNLLTQPIVFGSALARSDPSVFKSFNAPVLAHKTLINVVITMHRAIKCRFGRVVCRRRRFVCNGVNIYDRCL